MQAGERRAVDRVKKVKRDRINAQFSQGEREIDDVFVGLSHADNPTAARRETHRFDVVHRLDSIRIGVGRADVGMMALTGVQVVIDALHPGVF